MLKSIYQLKIEQLQKGGPGSGRHAYGAGAQSYFRGRLGVGKPISEEDLKARKERKEQARKERWMPVFSKPKAVGSITIGA